MTTLRFMKALALELDTTVDDLDERAAEHVLDLYGSNTKHMLLAARVYKDVLEDQIQP